MGFTTSCFIRKNTTAIQELLKDLGYHICPCCNFKRSVWLSTHITTQSVHGIGYDDETRPTTLEEELAFFLAEKREDVIDCKKNAVLFLALAALRDDSNYMQWFICNEDHIDEYTGKQYYKDDWELNMCTASFDKEKEIKLPHWRKATIEEIKEQCNGH